MVPFLAGMVSFIGVALLLIQPQVRSNLFFPLRRLQLQTFIHDSVKNQSINAANFWQLRDQYGAGYFVLSPNHTIYRESQELVPSPVEQIQEISSYYGNRVDSKEYLVPKNEEEATGKILDNLIPNSCPATKLLLQTNKSKMGFCDSNTLFVAFIKTLPEIAKVDGVFGLNPDEIGKLSSFDYASVTRFTMK